MIRSVFAEFSLRADMFDHPEEIVPAFQIASADTTSETVALYKLTDLAIENMSEMAREELCSRGGCGYTFFPERRVDGHIPFVLMGRGRHPEQFEAISHEVFEGLGKYIRNLPARVDVGMRGKNNPFK